MTQLYVDAEQNRIISELATATQAEPGPDPKTLDPECFSPDGRRGYIRNVQAGGDPVQLLSDLSPDLLQAILSTDPSAQPGPVLKTVSAHTILTTLWPEPTWAIPGILPVGLCLLAGKPKVGKSWLALQVAQAVATGVNAFEKPVQVGPVLYLALEDTHRRLQDRMRLQLWSASKAGDADFMTLGDFQDQVGELTDPLSVARLISQMHARKYRLVVVDTLSRAFRGDQNDADTMTRALSPIQAAALDLNCVVLLIDHHRKASAASSDPITDVSGSVAKGGTADCLWGLYKEQGKPGAILHVIGRDVNEQRLQLMHDPVTRIWECEGDADKLLTDGEKEVLDAVARLGKTQLMNVVIELGKPTEEKGNVHNRLQSLVNKAQLRRDKENGAVYYEVVDPYDTI